MTESAPLVLVPGMLCDDDLWSDIGEVASAPVIFASISRRSITEMAAEVLDSAPPRFLLGGLSLGAIVGFEIIRQAPERVLGFCAMSTNAGAPTDAQRESWLTMAARTDHGEFAAVVQDIIAPTMFRDPTPPAELRERFRRMAHRIGPDVFRAQLAAQATRIDSIPHLHKIVCPTIVLAAEDDTLCPPAFHRAIADAVPHARLEIIPDVGHLCTWESPTSVSAILRDWIITNNLDHPQPLETTCQPS
ncbi:alpha/beta hydrolase [Gordonia sp. CPCC 205515]|uniref:alpha/beta fold hydrolase n=1 Tax=Gordonia sp. CPCC 205515 TaxID=3140791 RepID=UPI003AF3F26F